jgi:acyl dehydratase
MPIDPQHLMELRARGERIAYGSRDAMLYALGIGFGRDPSIEGELGFVFEGGEGLKVAPTYASALAQSVFLKGCGWNESQLVPGSERLTVHRPLSPSGTLLLDCDVIGVRDLGRDAGALVVVRMTARNAGNAQPMFAVERSIVARADGGFGAGLGVTPAWHELPRRTPDLACELEVRPEQGLIYRLSGDLNPIHADPAVARRAGLPGPVMQNLCTLGVACRGILGTICDFDPTLVAAIEARYTGGVYPGDRLRLDLWQDANVVSFQATASARDRVVLDNGRCTLAA